MEDHKTVGRPFTYKQITVDLNLMIQVFKNLERKIVDL